MAYLDPVVILFGSNKTLSTIKIRIPVSFSLVFDESLLIDQLTCSSVSHNLSTERYFVVLLEPVSPNTMKHLQESCHVQVIYVKDKLTWSYSRQPIIRNMHKYLPQFTLDLTTDIAHFLTNEGRKQTELNQVELVRIYYRQTQVLKEWAMSFIKAEPCNILVIPLNTNQANVDGALQHLNKICNTLGFESTIIRTLDNYVPSAEQNTPLLIPYSADLFSYENPNNICKIIKRLSCLRLYLYGNEQHITKTWSNLMIRSETNLMGDEDNWCTFIENEYIDDEIKWNFGAMIGEQLQFKQIAPINLSKLDGNLFFQSALCRSFKTLTERQLEVTSDIFAWHEKGIENGYIHIKPKLNMEQAQSNAKNALFSYHPDDHINSPSSFRYRSYTSQTVSFVWLNKSFNSPDAHLNKIVLPYKWNLFNNVSECLVHIEHEIRQKCEIFLVTSGSLAYELFLVAKVIMPLIKYVYIFFSKSSLFEEWTTIYPRIQGIFNDSYSLGEQLTQHIRELQQSNHNIANAFCEADNKSPRSLVTVIYEDPSIQTTNSIAWTVYDTNNKDAFIAHQRTIDTLLCTPHTPESRTEMIAEFYRLHSTDDAMKIDIRQFEQTYNSAYAVEWYSRDTFLFRTINSALRLSNIEIMFKMRYFLIDLYLQLDKIDKQTEDSFFVFHKKVYRGQIMSYGELEYFRKMQGHVTSVNTFLSTTTSLQVALTFANTHSYNNQTHTSIIFCIEIDRSIHSRRPFAYISRFSLFQDEDEVLFSMGSIFNIQSVKELDRLNKIPVIYLTMLEQASIDLSEY